MAAKKVFMLREKSGKRVETPYDFIFTHYIPINSYGGSAVAFKFVGVRDDFGNIDVSEIESGKLFGTITPYDQIKMKTTSDKTAAKKLIENMLSRYGADKIYSVLSKA
jgi:hypothetical protein